MSALRRFVALAVILAAGGLSGCSGSSCDEEVTIYSGRTENLIGEVLERFHTETGICIAVRYGETPDLALLLDQEGESTEADVFLSQSPGAMDLLDEAGRLAKLPESVLDEVDEAYRAPDGDWVGLSGRRRVLVYNTALVSEDELPDSVFDLTDPAYAGKVAVAPSNGSFQDFITAMRADIGDEETLAWLEGLAANDAQTYTNNNAIVEAVSSGDIEMGLVNHYYNHRFLAEDPDLPSLNHDFPETDIGSLVIVSGAAVMKGSDEEDAAVRLISFMLEDEAQRYFSDETFEYPLARGVEPAAELPPLTGGYRIDLSGLGDLESTIAIIDESGIDD